MSTSTDLASKDAPTEMRNNPLFQTTSATSFSNFETGPVGVSTEGGKTRGQEVLHQIKSTVLDQVVNRFSLVEDHKIRGKWKTIFTVMIICFPLTVFIVMMWYQLYHACVAQSAFYGVSSSESINSFLKQDGIHYCASTFQFSGIVTDDVYYQNLYFETGFTPCHLPGDFGEFNFRGQCNIYEELFTVPADPKGCFGGGSIQVMYSQCTATQTAIVNSIQYTVYACIITIYLYLALRVIKKNGFLGLFVPKHWSAVLNNKNFAQDIGTGDRSSIV